MQADRPSLGAPRAIKLGLEQAISLWPATLLLFLCRSATLFCGTAAGLVLLRVPASTEVQITAALAGIGTAWLTAHLLRVLVLGGGIRQASYRLRSQPRGTLTAQAVSAAPRSLSYLLFGTLLELASDAYRVLLLGVAGWLYVEALGQQKLRVPAAAALAFALTIALPLWLAVRLGVDVAFARSAGRDEGYLASLYESAGALWRRPWAPLGVLVLTGALAWGADVALSGMVRGVASPSSDSFDLALAGYLVGGLLVAFPTAILELGRLGAYLALDLDSRGELPAPPAPEPAPIVDAEPIIAALPVPPSDGPLPS